MPTDEQITLVVDAKDVEDVIGRLGEAVNMEGRADGIKREVQDTSEDIMFQEDRLQAQRELAESTKALVDAAEGEGAKIPGVNREARMLLGKIPGVREGLGVVTRLRMMMKGVPSIGALLLVLWVAQMVTAAITHIEQTQQEYKRMAMEAGGMVSNRQFSEWQENDRRATASLYRSGVVQ